MDEKIKDINCRKLLGEIKTTKDITESKIIFFSDNNFMNYNCSCVSFKYIIDISKCL